MLPRKFSRICALAVKIAAVVAILLASMPITDAGPDRQDTLQELVYGQTVDDRVDEGQPSVFYTFDAVAEDVITVTMVVTEGDLDPFIVLNTADRTPLATDDNSGGGVNARLTFVIPTTGQYIIQATHAGGVPPVGGGQYSLNLTAAVDNIPPQTDTTTDTPVAPVARPQEGARLTKLAAGDSVQRELTAEEAMHVYWFEAQTGDQIAIAPTPGVDFLPRLELFDAQFDRIVGLSDTDETESLNFTVEQSGIYFLAASLDALADEAPYSFDFAHTANPLTSGNILDIAYGVSQLGGIDDAVSAVTYRFQGAAGDRVTVTMTRAQGDLDSYLYLLDDSGQLLYEDNDSGGTNGDARIAFDLPDDGTYLVVATRLGQTQGTTSGSYTLSLVSDAVLPVVEETADPEMPIEYATLPQLSYGETIDGEISNAKFVDFYVFLGQAGDDIVIEMDSGNLDEPDGLDPLLILLDGERIPLVENDDIVEGQERDARITYTLPQTSYYAVVATRFEQDSGTSSGPYTLTLTGPRELSTPASDSAATLLEKLAPTPLSPEVPQQTTFDSVGHLFTFAANAEDVIDITMSTDQDADIMLILADENLNEIASALTGTPFEIVIPKTGDYLLVALALDPARPADGAGYVLTYSPQTTSEPAPELTVVAPQKLAVGDTINGTIDDDNPSQVYTFSGQDGDRIRITMEATPGSDLDCYLELQDENGVVLAANDDIDPGIIRDARIVADVPAEGTYTIVASRFVEPGVAPSSGNYRLTLEPFDQDTIVGVNPLTIPLTYGQTEVDEINDDQYLLFYVFDGTQGDVVTIEVEHLSGNLDSVLHLYRSEGENWVLMMSNDDSPTGGTYAPLLRGVTLPQTGKYLIAISRYGLDRETTTGVFALTLSKES